MTTFNLKNLLAKLNTLFKINSNFEIIEINKNLVNILNIRDSNVKIEHLLDPKSIDNLKKFFKNESLTGTKINFANTGEIKVNLTSDKNKNLNVLLDLSQFKEFDIKYRFSPSETKIIQFIKSGLVEKEIAEKLDISIFTVKKHKQNIRKKLKINNKPVNLKTYLSHIL